MKKSLIIVSMLIALTLLAGCASLSYEEEGALPAAQFSDGTVSATLEIRKDNKEAMIRVANESDSVIEIAWDKASFKGGPLIRSGDYRNPNAQPIPATLLQQGGTSTQFVASRAGSLYVSGSFYQQMPWAEYYKQGDFVLAYTIDGEQRFITL